MKELIITSALIITLGLGITGQLNEMIIPIVNEISSLIDPNFDVKPDFDAKWISVD